MTLCDGLTTFASRCQSYGPDFPHGDLEVTKEAAVGLLPLMCCSAKRDRLNQWVIAAAAVRCRLEGGEIDRKTSKTIWQFVALEVAATSLSFWILFKQHSQSLRRAQELQRYFSTSRHSLNTYEAFEELGEMKEDLKAIFLTEVQMVQQIAQGFSTVSWLKCFR